jgi:ABC-type Fe3+-siderophore transport system permease subunit
MKGLKNTLWVCAIVFLLSFIFAALPWRAITAWANQFGVQIPDAEPWTVFWARLLCATFGMIGVFFVFLARNPLEYGGMLLLSAYGLLFLGVAVLMGSLRYELPFITYIVDVIFCFITGTLILLFRRKAIQENNALI